MESQLALIESLVEAPPADWKLDERTKAVGRRGIAQAREALRRAARPASLDELLEGWPHADAA